MGRISNTLRTELHQNLIYALVTGRKIHSLTPEERLFIVSSLGEAGNALQRASLLFDCACYEAARPIYEEYCDWRKLGQIAWIEGNEKKALSYFQRPEKAPRQLGRSRFSPDHDLILLVLFLRRDWKGFISAWRRAKPRRAIGTSIVVNNLAVDGSRWMRRLAIAITQAGKTPSPEFVRSTLKVFGISHGAWLETLAWARQISKRDIGKEVEGAVPTFLHKTPVPLPSVIRRGRTPNARLILEWIKNVCDNLDMAKADLHAWLKRGDVAALERAVHCVTGSEIFEMTKSVLWAVGGRKDLNLRGPAKRALTVCYSHPHLVRLLFPKLIQLTIATEGRISDETLLTGVYQGMANPFDIEKRLNDRVGIRQLRSCEEWVLTKLRDWRRHDGKELVSQVEKAVGHGRSGDPRRMPLWTEMVDEAIEMLNAHWENEIQTSPWVSENLVYETIKNRLKGFDVIQHAQPVWLTPQHLDVFVPEMKLAVEYMGLQHYEPIEFFGGREGLIRTQRRDRRKAEICQMVGVQLFYIRHDEDISDALFPILKSLSVGVTRSNQKAAIVR